MDMLLSADGVGQFAVVNTQLLDKVPATFDELMQELAKHPEAVKFDAPSSTREFVITFNEGYSSSAVENLSLSNIYGDQIECQK